MPFLACFLFLFVFEWKVIYSSGWYGRSAGDEIWATTPVAGGGLGQVVISDPDQISSGAQGWECRKCRAMGPARYDSPSP